MNPNNQANNTDDDDEASGANRVNEVEDSTSHNSTAKATTPTQQQRPSSTMTGASSSSAHREMKRTAAKELIERYFYQLQRGCGNPECVNANCASSGQVGSMDANEIAVLALQLFKQDAKLCDLYNSQAAPKVARTHMPDDAAKATPRLTDDGSRSDYSKDGAAIHQQQDAEMLLSPNENSTSSSSSGNSTITSGSSSRSGTSSGSSTSRSSTTTSNSNNTNLSRNEEAPLQADIIAPPHEEQQQLHKNAPSSSKRQLSVSAKVRNASGPPTPTLAPIAYLDEQLVDELLAECKRNNTYDRLLHAINEVYPHVEKLSQSYRRRVPLAAAASASNVSKLQELLGKAPSELKKEDLRMLEGENDKDEDSTVDSGAVPTAHAMDEDPAALLDGAMGSAAATMPGANMDVGSIDDENVDTDSDHGALNAQSNATWVDLESLRRVKNKLFELNSTAIGEALNNNIILLAESIRFRRGTDWERVLHCLIICFDMATNASNRFADLEYLELSLPKLCHAVRILPIAAQARLARIWATHCKDQLHSLVQCCQQLITLQVILDEDTVQENSDVIAVTKVLKIAFHANILAGQLERPKLYGTESSTSAAALEAAAATSNAMAEEDDIFYYTQVPKPHYPRFAEDKLEQELNVTSIDCRVPLVPYEEFYNEPLSDAIQMDRDYLSYRNLSLDRDEDAHFSFMLYSFILTPATKVIALYYDSRIRMYSERNSSIYALLNNWGDDAGTRPDLKLKVRRDNLIDDALIGLELVAMSNPKDLKKQLVVEFVGEQGIDEGGVSKEFFQLIVEEIFNPDFGMFTHQEDTNTVWFNSTPWENDAQFTLIGIILGLAMYNNIILAVNFPMVVYRKLMGGRGTYYDLADWNPTLYRSLKSLLDYEELDMEDVFMQTFKISYTNVFGEVVEHELKPGGSEISVVQTNKEEFVDLYSDFLLNLSIERQFRAFKKGFEMVTDESPLKLLFRPEEIELLVCGSRKFDFVELEKSTEYEGGYTKDTQIIKDFWQIVHAMPEITKRKLLEFTTGSDRVPVGGLSRLKLLITRHGSDSDRLPTSHTCFNVLLLPEYVSKEKLEERLLKAINYSKGFGML